MDLMTPAEAQCLLSQGGRETKTVKVWRTVIDGCFSNSACAGDLNFPIDNINFLDFALVSLKKEIHENKILVL